MRDEGYVHDPDATGESRPDERGAPLSERRGWALVALLAACLVGAPLAILVWPPTFLSYADAYLALALVPGVVLGAGAVWTAVRWG